MFFNVCRVLLPVALTAAALSAQAAPAIYVFDKPHADITFTVSHLGYSNTHGRFNEFDGKFMLDPEDLPAGSVELSIKTASIETSWRKRNDHLKSADFFDVENYPEMNFVSTGISMDTENTGTITGDLTLLGQTHPVTLSLVVNKIAPHPRSKKMTAGFTATGSLLRSQWGMDKFVPGIADEIHLRIDMEASEEPV